MKFEKGLVLTVLKKGKCNAISRATICEATGFSDRKVRKIIEELKNDGCLIAAATTGGYYIIQSEAEAEDYFRREFAKAKTLFANLKNLKENINDKFANINLEFAGRLF